MTTLRASEYCLRVLRASNSEYCWPKGKEMSWRGVYWRIKYFLYPRCLYCFFNTLIERPSYKKNDHYFRTAPIRIVQCNDCTKLPILSDPDLFWTSNTNRYVAKEHHFSYGFGCFVSSMKKWNLVKPVHVKQTWRPWWHSSHSNPDTAAVGFLTIPQHRHLTPCYGQCSG